MAIAYYDKAIIEKLSNWTKNTQITITSPNETKRLFETIADKNNDKPIKLPLLALTRNLGYNVSVTAKKPLTFNGMTLDATMPKSLQLNAIPVEIPYQLDIYTRYFEEADEYARNLIFNLINFPNFTVMLPYQNANADHEANITLSGEVEDNSDIPERLISGQFTRLSLHFVVKDAYLFDVRTRDNWCICGNVVTSDEYNNIEKEK